MINYLNDLFSSRGYILLTKEYTNSKVKLDYICPKGHRGSIRLDHFRDGYGCPVCNRGGRVNTSIIRSVVEQEGYTVNSIDRDSTDYTLDLVCPEGHKIRMKWRKWKSGFRCYVCDGRLSVITYEQVLDSFEQEGYELLSTSYRNSSSYLYYKCPEGHTGKIIWSNWKKGIRCGKCRYVNLRLSKNQIQEFLAEENKKVLSVSHIGDESPLVLIECGCGEKFEAKLRNLRRTGPRCPNCDRYHSVAENYLYDYLCKKDLDVLRNRWDITKTRSEIDIVIPSLKLGIEYCGLYWHSEISGGKKKNYHLDKLLDCEKNSGYSLVTIFEDEFVTKPELVLSRLASLIGRSDGFKIYARECSVTELDSKECNIFLRNYHLQGSGNSSVKLGLFYGDYLVAVMTFSKQNISKGLTRKEGQWELDRFCSHLGYCVVGAGSKLLSWFEVNYNPSFILSYADRRWSTGGLYKKLGFVLDGNTQPNYWYTCDYKTRLHRFSLRKNKDDDPSMTEWENRVKQGYDRIWDCGNLRFIKRIKEDSK